MWFCLKETNQDIQCRRLVLSDARSSMIGISIGYSAVSKTPMNARGLV